ncbi:hypothetical protein D3C79_892080 [compost metagenome]
MGISRLQWLNSDGSRLQRLEHGSVARSDGELAADIGKVEVDGGFRATLNPGDLPGRLAFKAPLQGLCLFRCQLHQRSKHCATGCILHQGLQRLLRFHKNSLYTERPSQGVHHERDVEDKLPAGQRSGTVSRRITKADEALA